MTSSDTTVKKLLPEGDLKAAGRLQVARHDARDRPHHGHEDHQENGAGMREFSRAINSGCCADIKQRPLELARSGL